jgi:hypothetical protein
MMYGELKVEIHTFLIRVLDGGEWPEWCVGHFAVMEKELVMTGKKLSGSPSRRDVLAKSGYRVLPGHPSQ